MKFRHLQRFNNLSPLLTDGQKREKTNSEKYYKPLDAEYDHINLHVKKLHVHKLTLQMRSCRPCHLADFPDVLDRNANKPRTRWHPRKTVLETADQQRPEIAEQWRGTSDWAADVARGIFQKET